MTHYDSINQYKHTHRLDTLLTHRRAYYAKRSTTHCDNVHHKC